MTLQGQTTKTSVIDKARVKVCKLLKTSTHNVRTLLKKGQIHQLIKGCKENNLDIVAIQEHRWRTQNDIDILKNHGYDFFYASASKEGHGGVGILIKNQLANCILRITKVNSRIITMTLRCNPQITIISVYTLTELAQVEAKDSFYDELHTTISSIPAHSFLLVLGDFNAHIGKTSHESSPQTIGRYFYHQETNDNSERFISLCEISRLISTFHCQPHRNSHMWTWEHPDGVHKAQIDHILLGGKWRNSVRTCRAYSIVELGSDHNCNCRIENQPSSSTS